MVRMAPELAVVGRCPRNSWSRCYPRAALHDRKAYEKKSMNVSLLRHSPSTDDKGEVPRPASARRRDCNRDGGDNFQFGLPAYVRRALLYVYIPSGCVRSGLLRVGDGVSLNKCEPSSKRSASRRSWPSRAFRSSSLRRTFRTVSGSTGTALCHRCLRSCIPPPGRAPAISGSTRAATETSSAIR